MLFGLDSYASATARGLVSASSSPRKLPWTPCPDMPDVELRQR